MSNALPGISKCLKELMSTAWAFDEQLGDSIESCLASPAAEILSWLRGLMEWGHTRPPASLPGSGSRRDLATSSSVNPYWSVWLRRAESY